MPRWSRETVIEACAALDADRLAEGIMEPLTAEIINELCYTPEIPSVDTIYRHVGTMPDLQALLGRVTTPAVESWSDETWAQNAQWAQDVLAAEGVPKITDEHLKRLGAAGLMPNIQVIRRRWGSVPAYRIATGIEDRPTYWSAMDWERGSFVANGKAFAEELGLEIGFPVMPRQKDIRNAAAQDKTPTLKQIKKEFGSFEDYQAALGFVNLEVTQKWTDEQWVENYQWLCDVWTENGYPVPSLQSLLKVAGQLHIGPTYQAVRLRWGTLTEYGKAVGREQKYAKRHLPLEGLTRAAINIFTETRRPLTKNDLRNHAELSPDTVVKRIGGLTALNLRLGVIGRAHGLPRDAFLWWGVTHFVAQEGKLPTRQDIADRSKQGIAPSDMNVYKLFGNMTEYHRQLEHSAEWLRQQLFNFDHPVRSNGNRLNPTVLTLAIKRNPDLFHPERPLDPEELKVFYRLKNAGVDLIKLGILMDSGISFHQPELQLTGLATMLAEKGCLTSKTLRDLEPYIIGLAPPLASMSWSDFIAAHRAK